jgi:hypothetical protein
MGTMNGDEFSWEEKLVINQNRDEQQTKQTMNQNPTIIPIKYAPEVQIQEQDHSNISETTPEGNQMQAEKKNATTTITTECRNNKYCTKKH